MTSTPRRQRRFSLSSLPSMFEQQQQQSASDEKQMMIAKISELKTKVLQEFEVSQLEEFAVHRLRVDALLTRFLQARDLDVEKTLEMIRNALEWRQRENIPAILHGKILSSNEFDAIRYNYPQGFHGTDREGHPVWIERTGYIDIDEMMNHVTPEQVVKHHCQTLEYLHQVMFPKCSEKTGRIVDKMTVIHDLSKVGSHNIRQVVFEVIKSIAQMDQDYYPETLHKLFIINAPLVFYATWKMIKIFLNDVTQKKIVILGKDYATEVQKVISPDQLPSFLGGTCVCDAGKLHDGCISSKDLASTKFFTELDQHVASNMMVANNQKCLKSLNLNKNIPVISTEGSIKPNGSLDKNESKNESLIVIG